MCIIHAVVSCSHDCMLINLIFCSCGTFAHQSFIWNNKKYMNWLKLRVISAPLVCMCAFLLLWNDIHKLYLFKMLKRLSRLTRRKAINCDNTRRTWAHNDRSNVPTAAPRATCAKVLVLHNEMICMLRNTAKRWIEIHFRVFKSFHAATSALHSERAMLISIIAA